VDESTCPDGDEHHDGICAGGFHTALMEAPISLRDTRNSNLLPASRALASCFSAC
jgi:hypothetical protein